MLGHKRNSAKAGAASFRRLLGGGLFGAGIIKTARHESADWRRKDPQQDTDEHVSNRWDPHRAPVAQNFLVPLESTDEADNAINDEEYRHEPEREERNLMVEAEGALDAICHTVSVRRLTDRA